MFLHCLLFMGFSTLLPLYFYPIITRIYKKSVELTLLSVPPLEAFALPDILELTTPKSTPNMYVLHKTPITTMHVCAHNTITCSAGYYIPRRHSLLLSSEKYL